MAVITRSFFVLWSAPILAAGLLRPGRSRTGADRSAAILAAVLSDELNLVAALFQSGTTTEQ